MKLNGNEENSVNKDILDISKPEDKTNKIGKKPPIINKVSDPKQVDNLAKDDAKPMDMKAMRKIGMVSTLVLAVIMLISTIICGWNLGSNWFSYKSDMKYIEKTYHEDLMNSKVYTQIIVKTANILGYENGVCTTDLGDIECDKPDGTVMLVFNDLEGVLRPLSSITAKGDSMIEYVTDNFVVPDDAVVVRGGAKDEYSAYLVDLESAMSKQDKANSYRTGLIVSLGTLVVAAGLFFIIRSINTKAEENGMLISAGIKTDKAEDKAKDDKVSELDKRADSINFME